MPSIFHPFETVMKDDGMCRCWFLTPEGMLFSQWEVTLHSGAVWVTFSEGKTWTDSLVWRFELSPSDSQKAREGRLMGSKFLQLARAKKAGNESLDGCNDPWMFKDRPALAEFMTLLVVEGGEIREPSVLMIVPKPDGFAVGLKDDDAGGWLWRNGDTVAKALTLIEKALSTGEARFTSSQSGKAQKRKGGS